MLTINKTILSRLELLQNKLRNKVVLTDTFDYPPKVVTGFDLAYNDNMGFVAAVSLDYSSLSVIETKVFTSYVRFPYIPTFLAFREAPLIVQVLKRLKMRPDVILVDGHGIAHPRKMGSATYIGVITELPSIGVAKRNLCDVHKPPINAGESKPVFLGTELVGYAIKTKPQTSPIFVSPGSGVSLKTTKKIVLHLIKDHKLPEPLYLADKLSRKTKKELLDSKDNLSLHSP